MAIFGAACSTGSEKGISGSERARLDISSSNPAEAQKSVSATPTVKPTETKKPAVENKISISKKPDELYRTLLSSHFPDSMLPQNVTLKEKSAGNLDYDARTLKAIGQVNIILLDKNVLTVFDNPNGGIFYTIFPDASSAKSAYLMIANSTNSETELKDFAFPAFVFFSPFRAGPMFTMAFENVLVRAVIAGPDQDTYKKEAVILGKAASEYLKKVGR